MKFLIVLAISCLSFSAFANYGPSGCGLGSMLLKDSKGLVTNVLAATINGISGNQTFGMSSGTLGCNVDDSTMVAAVSYIEANKVALLNDIARGSGETLASLGQIYRCSSDQFASALQSNYEQVIRAEASAQQLDRAIRSITTGNASCI
jgi:hypothetical protein